MMIVDNQGANEASGNVGEATAPRLVVKQQVGAVQDIRGQDGLSVMEIIRGAGIDELPALCGGSCSCATCHVYVAPEWIARLPMMSDEESAVLEEAPDRNALSRLSCQIRFSPALNGLEVAIARME